MLIMRPLADPPFRARDAATTRIAQRRRVERATEGFERRLQQMMGVPAGELTDVERTPRTVRERDEEVGHEVGVERADHAGLRLEVAREEWPSAEVERDRDQAFIHRDLERRVAH